MRFSRIALIYDDTIRADTTGGYCRRALQELAGSGQGDRSIGSCPTRLEVDSGDDRHPHLNPPPSRGREGSLGRADGWTGTNIAEVRHFRSGQLADLPPDFDLYLCIDDGLDYALPEHLKPAAFWVIDTHLAFERSLRRARGFDYVFAAQKEGAAALRRAGIQKCEWLPLACDPEVHERLDLEKVYDVAFVGHDFPGARRDLLQQIKLRFPNSFIGTAPHTEMAQIYSQARIAINCCLKNDLNMRVFEALACGTMLVTNRLYRNGQDELFLDRTHLVEYSPAEEALALIDYYLQNEKEREAITRAGYEEVVKKHTYRLRMERLLARCAQLLEENDTTTQKQTNPPPQAAAASPSLSPRHDKPLGYALLNRARYKRHMQTSDYASPTFF